MARKVAIRAMTVLTMLESDGPLILMPSFLKGYFKCDVIRKNSVSELCNMGFSSGMPLVSGSLWQGLRKGSKWGAGTLWIGQEEHRNMGN